MKQFIQKENLDPRYFSGDGNIELFKLNVAKASNMDFVATGSGLLITEKDTGWYDIIGSVITPADVTLQGKVYLRRLGNKVYMAFEDFRWDKVSSQMKFLPPSICAYTHPYWDSKAGGVKLRFGGVIPADNRNANAFIYDWLGKDVFRLVSQTGLYRTYASIHWLTETPFPTDDNIIGTKIG